MKGYELVKEILKKELEDYGYFKYGEINLDNDYEQTKEDEYYEVDITSLGNEIKTLNFHYDRKKDILEIRLGEESFEETNFYDWRVKYFWMALLKW